MPYIDRLLDAVRHEEDRHAGTLGDLVELQLQPGARLRVQGTERLVHQEDRRVQGQRPGDRDTLLHPA